MSCATSASRCALLLAGCASIRATSSRYSTQFRATSFQRIDDKERRQSAQRPLERRFDARDMFERADQCGRVAGELDRGSVRQVFALRHSDTLVTLLRFTKQVAARDCRPAAPHFRGPILGKQVCQIVSDGPADLLHTLRARSGR